MDGEPIGLLLALTYNAAPIFADGIGTQPVTFHDDHRVTFDIDQRVTFHLDQRITFKDR